MMKKTIFLFVIVFLMCLPIVCFASNDYQIDRYNTIISIDRDNNFEVVENIEITAHKMDAVIKKELPYNVIYYDINSSYEIETTDKKIITINNSHGQVNSDYKVTYTLPNNNDKNAYTIEIVNSYDSMIKESSFTINLPSSVTKENISFIYDGEDITNDIDYKIEGNKIIGSYNKALLSGDKIVLEVKYNQIYLNYIHYFVIVGPIILLIISYFIWRYYGKDLQVNVVKSFTLPKELTPLDIALVKNEIVTEDDVFAFLIYLANKGYIRIYEEQNNVFYLERVKDYNGDNYKEEVFIKSLFRKNLKISLSEYIDIVTSKKKIKQDEKLEKKIDSQELEYRYKRALTNILPAVNNNEEKSIYYELESDRKKNILIFFVAIILVLITSIPFIEINKLYLLPLSVFYSIIALKILINITDTIKLDDFSKKKKNSQGILLSILIFLLCIILLIPSFKRNLIYTMAFFISFICVIMILVLYKFMPKRTLYGSKVYAKLLGLKIFVDTCDKSNLELALKKNDNYLFDLLAYSYILGNVDKVFNLFKECEIKKPSWYILKDDFTFVKFNNSLKRLKSVLSKKNEELS